MALVQEPIEVRAYSHSDPNTLLDVLNGAVEPNVLEELKGPGGGSFKISRTDKKIVENPTLLADRNYYRMYVENRCVGGFIGKKQRSDVVKDNPASKAHLISGEGPRGWLDDAIVYPWIKPLRSGAATSRSFNFSSPHGDWYKIEEWNQDTVTTIVAPRADPNGSQGFLGRVPEDWPSGIQAKWVWKQGSTADSAQVGDAYFRQLFTSTGGSHTVYIAADDRFTFFMDGEEIATTAANSNAWSKTTRIDLEIPAGNRILGYKVSNAGGPAGLAIAIYKNATFDDSGNPNPKGLVFQTGSGNSALRIRAYPQYVPGWTPGEVMRTLIQEAKDRGVSVLNNYTLTFTNTHDSDGKPWEEYSDWTFNIGATLNDVLAGLEELAVEASFDPETLEFHMYVRRGRDRSVSRFVDPSVAINSHTNPEGVRTTISSRNKTATYGYYGFTPSILDHTQVPAPSSPLVKVPYFSRFTKVAAAASSFGMECKTVTANKRIYAKFLIRSKVNTTLRVNGMMWGKFSGPFLPITNSLPVTPGVTEHVLQFTTDAFGTNIMDWLLFSWDEPGAIGDYVEIGQPLIVVGAAQGVSYPYFSGSTPSDATSSNTWAGNPHYSTSARYSGTVIDRDVLVFEEGKNLLAADSETKADLKNAILVRTQDGWFEQFGQGSEKYGRLESRVNATTTVERARRIAEAVMSQKSVAEESASYSITPVDDHVPWKDFGVGDWVLAPDRFGTLVRRRVVSLSASQNGDNGTATYSAEFDTIFLDNEQKIKRYMEREGAGSLGSSFAGLDSGLGNTIGRPIQIDNPIVTTTYPAQVVGLAGTSTAAWDPQGLRTISLVSLTWSGVSTDIDGNSFTPTHYTVEARPTAAGAAAWEEYASTSGTSATIDSLPSGQEWKFRVRAWGGPDAPGLYSPEFTLTTAVPVTPMDAPDAPIVTSARGTMTVIWNGLLQGNPPPPQFRYVYALVGERGATWAEDLRNLAPNPNTVSGGGSFTVSGGTTAYVGGRHRVTASGSSTLNIRMNPQAGTAVGNGFGIAPGQRASYRVTFVNTNAFQIQIRPRLRWNNGTTFVSDTYMANVVLAPGETKTVEMSAIAPDGVNNVFAFIWATNTSAGNTTPAAGTMYEHTGWAFYVGADGAVPSSNLPFFSGSTGVELTKRYAWSGTANNSPSYRESTPAGSRVRAGSMANRNSLSIIVPNLEPEKTYDVTLVAVDGAGIPSPESAVTSHKVLGVDLGDLDQEVADAIEAAQNSTSDGNLFANPGMSGELGTLPSNWYVVGTSVWKSVVEASLPGRGVELMTTGTGILCNSFQFDAYDVGGMPAEIFLSARVLNTSGTGYLNIEWTDAAGAAIGYSTLAIPANAAAQTYTAVTGRNGFAAPPPAAAHGRGYFSHSDKGTGRFVVGWPTMRRMTDGDLIADGAILGRHIVNESIQTNHLAAGSVATVNLQAQAITAETIAADAIRARHIMAGEIEANHIKAGSIQTTHLSAGFGANLDISANDSVTIIAGQAHAAQDAADAVADNLAVQQTYYKFGTNGAEITTPNSPYSLVLKNDQIQILENGNVVSKWTSGQFQVTQFVGEVVTLGNHQLEKYNNGTVVRALGAGA